MSATVQRVVACPSCGASPETARPRLVQLPVVLTVADMARLLDRSERSIRALVAEGQFPVPMVEGFPSPIWHRKDVQAWLSRTTFDPKRVAS